MYFIFIITIKFNMEKLFIFIVFFLLIFVALFLLIFWVPAFIVWDLNWYWTNLSALLRYIFLISFIFSAIIVITN